MNVSNMHLLVWLLANSVPILKRVYLKLVVLDCSRRIHLVGVHPTMVLGHHVISFEKGRITRTASPRIRCLISWHIGFTRERTTFSCIHTLLARRNKANVHSFENGVHLVSLALMTTCILFNLLKLIAPTDVTIVPYLCWICVKVLATLGQVNWRYCAPSFKETSKGSLTFTSQRESNFETHYICMNEWNVILPLWIAKQTDTVRQNMPYPPSY